MPLTIVDFRRFDALKYEVIYCVWYNAPASISVKNSWDFDVFGSFIYWHVSEEGLTAAYLLPETSPTIVGSLKSPHFTYQPGFQVGFGFDTNYDDWTGWAKYTRLHQKTNKPISANNPVEESFTIPWIIEGGSGSVAIGDSATSFDVEWKMLLDMLDAAFSRPFYQGTKIVLSPYAGMRALSIRQNYTIASAPQILQQGLVQGSVLNTISVSSRNWAIGPMLGSFAHWMLGKGFRFEGSAGASILYTRYTSVRHKEILLAQSGFQTFVSRAHSYTKRNK